MKTLKIVERDGKGKDAPIKSEFSVLNFPNNYDELDSVIVDNADLKATVYSLFSTQFSVFSRSKVESGETVEFVDVLAIVRKQASGDKVRKAILEQQIANGQLLAAGKIDVAEFTELLQKSQTDLAALDVREIEHAAKLEKSRAAKQAKLDKIEKAKLQG